MEYIVDDKKLDAFTFIAFVKQVWQGNYDIEKTQCALSQTINITAYENEALIGCLRILTDGYYFGNRFYRPQPYRKSCGLRDRREWNYLLRSVPRPPRNP